MPTQGFNDDTMFIDLFVTKIAFENYSNLFVFTFYSINWELLSFLFVCEFLLRFVYFVAGLLGFLIWTTSSTNSRLKELE